MQHYKRQNKFPGKKKRKETKEKTDDYSRLPHSNRGEQKRDCVNLLKKKKKKQKIKCTLVEFDLFTRVPPHFCILQIKKLCLYMSYFSFYLIYILTFFQLKK